MSDLLIKNVPDDLRKRLMQSSKRKHCSMSREALALIERGLVFLNILATAGKTAAVPKALLLEIWTAAASRLLDAERTLESAHALALAVDLRISANDAQYLALAESLGDPCITEDSKLVKASGRRALRMAEFLAAAS